MTKRIILFLLAAALLLGGCEQPSVLERVQASGELLVATRWSPASYFQGPQGPAGLEYDLITRFADELGVAARFVHPQPLRQLLSELRRGRVHMAAAGLTVTPEREQTLRFSRAYQTVTQQLVYRRGNYRPKELSDLGDGMLEVVADSSHAENIARQLGTGRPQAQWRAAPEYTSEELLARVNDGALAYTVMDSNELALNRRYYAHVEPALDISAPEDLAWAFPDWPDDSLVEAADAFLQRMADDGTLQRLLEHYYGYVGRLQFVDKREFQRHLAERLPVYQPHFEEASALVDLDWRLLAAVGYQESHWDPQAVSPTGVRGIMMLTNDTATHIGIGDRADPRASILGGARYLRQIEAKIPDRIPEPDRLWLALAGYNIGFGHLEDARVLTQRQGGDPDRWAEVKKRLPLLSKKCYYSTLKHGYARGREPVRYVENVRNYYDLLVWHTNNARRQAQVGARGQASGG